jgi:hypothetical protein
MEIGISGFSFFYKLLAADSVSASKTTNLEMFQAPSLFDL